MVAARRVLFWLFVVLGAVGATWFGTPRKDALPPGGDFRLESAAGPVTLDTLRGAVGLVYFGYASCPDVCPVSLGLAGAALAELTPDEQAKVRLLFVSLDPERDTPASLATYAASFHPGAIGATAADAVLRDVATRYGVTFRRHGVESALGYVVDHTSQTLVLDPEGRVREVLPHGATVESVAAAARRYLGTATAVAPVAPAPRAADTVAVGDPFVRALPPGATVTAAYFTLRNPSAAPRALVRAATPVARVAELHAVLTVDGVTEMRPVPRFEVPAGGERALSPSGDHIMLVDVAGPLAPGDLVPLTLGYDDGSETTLSLPVR